MILTHFLVLLAAPPAGLSPASAQLPITDSGTSVDSPGRALTLIPALLVGAAPVLAVRGD